MNKFKFMQELKKYCYTIANRKVAWSAIDYTDFNDVFTNGCLLLHFVANIFPKLFLSLFNIERSINVSNPAFATFKINLELAHLL